MADDFLDQKKREITERLNELQPMVEEYQRLQAAQRALDGVAETPARPTPRRRRRPASSSASRSASAPAPASASASRGRPRGTGTRAKQALELVQETPGITIPELATRMGIKQNYLYRVLPGLEQDGLVRKQGRGWHPKPAA